MISQLRVRLAFAAALGAMGLPAVALADCPAYSHLPTGAEGAMGYDNSTHAMYYCNGTAWKSLSSGGSGSSTPICVEAESSANTGNRSVSSSSNASGGAYNGAYGGSGEYTTFAFNVATAGTYTITLTYASGEVPTGSVSTNGAADQSIALANTGGWDTFTTASLSASLTAGNNTVRVSGNNRAFNLDKVCVGN